MKQNYDKNYKLEILNEIKAQFYYHCGLFLIKDGIPVVEDIRMLLNVCFIISSLKSKPNQSKRQSKQSSNNKIEEYLAEYTNQSSCFRYTLIGT